MQALKPRPLSPIASRRGAAAVEFALVAPIFLVLVMGLAEYGKAINSYNTLYAAVREGGRLASMDFTSYVSGSQTANEKVIRDIRAILAASGFPPDEITITITEVDSTIEFDVSDPDNYLEMFRITASIPYEEISTVPVNYMSGQTLTASMVYRKGRVQVAE